MFILEGDVLCDCGYCPVCNLDIYGSSVTLLEYIHHCYHDIIIMCIQVSHMYYHTGYTKQNGSEQSVRSALGSFSQNVLTTMAFFFFFFHPAMFLFLSEEAVLRFQTDAPN